MVFILYSYRYDVTLTYTIAKHLVREEKFFKYRYAELEVYLIIRANLYSVAEYGGLPLGL